MQCVKVAVEGLPYYVGGIYSYLVPEKFQNLPLIGNRVTVPFGKGNALRRGFIVGFDNQESDKLKYIETLAADDFTLSRELVDLALFMSDKYLSPAYDCLRAMLPSGLELKISYYYTVGENAAGGEITAYVKKKEKVTEASLLKKFPDQREELSRLVKSGSLVQHTLCGRMLQDNVIRTVKIAADEQTIDKYLSTGGAHIEKHREVIDYLRYAGESAITETLYMTGVSQSVIDTLCKRDILAKTFTEVMRTPYKSEGKGIKTPLSEEQRQTAEDLASRLNSFNVSLLYGVTGSGKTHIFYDLMERVINSGKSAILMVPEIMLTVQTVNRLKDRFGNSVAVIHSALSAGERMDEWKRIKKGEAKIAVGTRSAVFAPFDNIGIIIMDEEQEHTYKSEMNPKYSTCAVAKQRAASHNAMLLLASATPSIESMYWAEKGKYSFNKLTGRFNKKASPTVKCVDMRRELRDGNMSVISSDLQKELEENLQRGEQSILFINRRGYNTFVSCRSCGYVEKCPNCSISLTYHIKNNRLMCHYCGYSKPTPTECPACKSPHIRFFGVGTQKAQEAIEQMFPTARVLRMDADTTTMRHSHEEMLNSFAKGDYDILLGTQMVTKGLDFANVTLVGILSADVSLNSDDFRAGEKTFSLISQVVGRAGRGEKSGRAIIQTYTPESRVISLAMVQDYDGFYKNEIALRKMMLYPPFSDICQILIMSESLTEAAEKSNDMFNLVADRVRDNKIPAVIIGPSPCNIQRMNGLYRYKLLIKCRADTRFREVLRNLTLEFYNNKENKNVLISTDINPGNIQ